VVTLAILGNYRFGLSSLIVVAPLTGVAVLRAFADVEGRHGDRGDHRLHG
jgi:hypothetical protein